MSLGTFTWIPSYSSELEWKPLLNDVDFGDGYVQSMPDGINNTKLRFQLVFQKVPSSEAAAVAAFIKGLGGTTPFYWTPPAPYNAAALIFKCKMFHHNWAESNAETISLEFEQSYNAT